MARRRSNAECRHTPSRSSSEILFLARLRGLRVEVDTIAPIPSSAKVALNLWQICDYLQTIDFDHSFPMECLIPFPFYSGSFVAPTHSWSKCEDESINTIGWNNDP